LLRQGHSLDDTEAAVRAAHEVNLAGLDRERLTVEGLGDAASRVAAMPKVRTALLKLQQDFARRPGGAVLDGRDTGTVIAPEADVKLFVTASPEVRAKRRFAELVGRGEATTYEQVLADIHRRDERDAERAVAPLKPAPDAALLDTTLLDIEAAFREVLNIVRRA
jgi:cytidylate kinase